MVAFFSTGYLNIHPRVAHLQVISTHIKQHGLCGKRVMNTTQTHDNLGKFSFTLLYTRVVWCRVVFCCYVLLKLVKKGFNFL